VVARSDGNGWVRCRCGHRHWGLHGAAGLVLLRRRGDGVEVLLQLRSSWTHQGGTWGVPGGARDSHEDVVTAALREAEEEVGVDPGHVEVVGTSVGTDHVGWRYTYVIGWADGTVRVHVRNDESDEVRWVPLDEIETLPLHPALAASWPDLRVRLAAVEAA
jgi:8-oxo-dGTP diphosphatase